MFWQLGGSWWVFLLHEKYVSERKHRLHELSLNKNVFRPQVGSNHQPFG